MLALPIVRRLALVGLAVCVLMPAATASGQPDGGAAPPLLVHIRPHSRKNPGALPVVVVVAQKEAVHRHGTGTARLVALGMEYPWGDLQARH